MVVKLAVLTLAVKAIPGDGSQRAPLVFTGRFQCAKIQDIRKKAQNVATLHTLDILEKHKVIAMVTVKVPHIGKRSPIKARTAAKK